MKSQRIVIVGMGPVGSILAAYLIRRGHDVTVIDIIREHLEKMRADGLEIGGKVSMSAPITQTFESVEAAARAGDKFDYVFVCVKTPVIKHILGSLPKILADDGSVISFQNGLDTGINIAKVIVPDNTLRGVVNYAGNPDGLGRAVMTFFNPPNYVGAAVDGATRAEAKAEQVADMLNQAGLKTEFTKEVQRHVWAKVIRNAALMPIAALTGMNMAQIMSSPQGSCMVEKLLEECIAVAAKQGHVFDQKFADDSLTYLRNGGPHRPSMLDDVLAGRITEIEFINGKIADYGQEHGMEVPYNRIMADLVGCIDQLHAVEKGK